MKNKLYLLMASTLVLLPFSACRQESGNEASSSGMENTASESAGEISLTREQFESTGMQLGDPSTVQFRQEVTATGYIAPAPSGKAKISPTIPGRIGQIYHWQGERVRKGTVLFSLESQEIMMIQQQYGMAFHELQLLNAEYERLKNLSAKDIASKKDFQKAESEFRSKEVEVHALQIRLQYMGIDPQEVEKGVILSAIRVISPVSGIISKQELVMGQYVEPSETLMEVLDPGKLRLELHIFEKSLASLGEGQKVYFSIPDQPDKQYVATLSHIGRSVDPQSRTVACYAKLEGSESALLFEHMYVECRIVTCERETHAVPEDALLREDGTDYALILTGESDQVLSFKKIPVKTGITQNGLTEILEKDLSNVLLKGAYNLWMED